MFLHIAPASADLHMSSRAATQRFRWWLTDQNYGLQPVKRRRAKKASNPNKARLLGSATEMGPDHFPDPSPVLAPSGKKLSWFGRTIRSGRLPC